MNLRAIALLLLLSGSLAAQSVVGSTVRHVRVRVGLPNNDCSDSVQVRLIGSNGYNVEANTNGRCEVEFESIPAGTYQMSVSGQNFVTNNATVTVSSISTDLEMKVKPRDDPRPLESTAAPTVSVADLAIPSAAQKKLAQAQSFSDRHDYKKAIQSLKEAIAIYPAYAAAYNNLGVAYGREGDREKEREALQHAIALNDHCAAAHANLARMDIAASDFAGAEAELTKAVVYDPANASLLSLLTYAEFMNHHFDEAIASSRRVHALPAPHAYVHQVAAEIYEQRNDGAAAIAELEQFLKEDPNNERADMVRQELARVRTILEPTLSRVH